MEKRVSSGDCEGGEALQSSAASLFDWDPTFRDNMIVATSRVEISIPYSWIFGPLKIRPPQRHEASITDHLVTYRHIPQERTPQLHRCERPTTVQSCKRLLLVQFDNYYEPCYFSKPSNTPGIGALDGRRRLRSTALLNEDISSAVRCHTIILLTENARRIKFLEVICDKSLRNVFVISLEFLY